MDFNRYFTNTELSELLQEWAERYSNILTLGTIGKSQEGRDIQILTITNFTTGPDTDKPAIWIDGNIHATEIAGTTTALRVAFELLSKYGQNDQISRLVDTSTFYIVPRLNPDGAELAMSHPPKYVRSGTRSYPFTEKEEGIHQQDVDGDGRILQMRLVDPNGDWKISTLNPKLLEKRNPDDFGDTYYRLLPEGMIEDFDGYVIKIARPVEGLDFNRNYPFEWRPESDQKGAGPYPTSEPEIRSAVEFITSHPNINAGIAYHTYSGVILRPYGTKPDSEMDTDDLWTFEAIGERAKELTGYKTISVFHEFKYHPKKIITGPSNDWLYDHLGIYGYVIELWDVVEKAGIEDRKFIEWLRKHPHEDDIKIYDWIVENVGEDAYVDWYPFEHPQLGQVEIGGYDRMYTWRNPPAAFMGEEAGRNIPFVLALGEMLPRLSVQTLEAKHIGDGKFHLNLVIDNTGYFSSYTSNQSKERKSARPVWVELKLPEEVKLVNGKMRTELGHLEGRSNKTTVFSYGASGTDNRARAEWVLQAKAGDKIIVNIMSDRAGKLRREVILK